MPIEEWRPVVGYEGWYDVSSLGRVRRMRPGLGTCVGHMLSPQASTKGYLMVLLYRWRRRRNRPVHRLVAEAFLGPCPPAHECNHRDGDKKNSAVSNLEWVTPSDNMRHAHRIGLFPNPGCPPAKAARGERSGRAKLTEADVHTIRDSKGRVTQTELASHFAVCQQVISAVQRRVSWKHVM